MNRIRVLPESVINKIAAGEVVERPASAVKELLENALDAGAAEIRIEIEGSGSRRISVVDDGEGMDRHEVLLALERHATSKIESFEDLESVPTRGFRGEALPSIAGVSVLEIVSRPPGELAGTRVLVEGGTVRDFGETGAPVGTAVTIRRLFFNTPARRKFLKSSRTEWAHILREVTARALVEPGVALRLEHDGREILTLPAAASPRERVADLWGREGMQAMLEVSGEAEGMAVRGWLESPASDSSPCPGLFLSVNGRPVHDRTILGAVREAYGTRLAGKGLPSGCLEVSLDPLDVDVNIHPAKREVKFRRPPAVRGLVAESVAAALRGRAGVFSPGFSGGETLFPESRPRPAADGIGENRQREWSFAPAAEPETEPAASGPGAAPFRVIGVARDSYLLAETAEGLLAVDQHAAHERILFERFEDALGAGPVEVQQLLSPLRLDLEPAAAENLRGHLGLLREMGIEVEEFGGDSWVVTALPALLAGRGREGLVLDVLREAGEWEGSVPDPRREIVARLACRAAVKAWERYPAAQGEALLADLYACREPGFCPHGRPTVLTFGWKELEKRFGRS